MFQISPTGHPKTDDSLYPTAGCTSLPGGLRTTTPFPVATGTPVRVECGPGFYLHGDNVVICDQEERYLVVRDPPRCEPEMRYSLINGGEIGAYEGQTCSAAVEVRKTEPLPANMLSGQCSDRRSLALRVREARKWVRPML